MKYFRLIQIGKKLVDNKFLKYFNYFQYVPIFIITEKKT